jgi:hypothetical protein
MAGAAVRPTGSVARVPDPGGMEWEARHLPHRNRGQRRPRSKLVFLTPVCYNAPGVEG